MKNINFPVYYSKKESKKILQFTHQLHKNISKGCWVCWTGNFYNNNLTSPGGSTPMGVGTSKALQRNLLTFYYCVSKHIAEVTLGDIACYP
jgi:hypothetical protein